MNSKNIKRHLNNKLNDWLDSITDEAVKTVIRKNAIITGGAIVSLLTGDKVKDYDVYFKDKNALKMVCEYYTNIWNKAHPDETEAKVKEDDERIKVFIQSVGVAGENPECDEEEPAEEIKETKSSKKDEKYRPIFFTSNAITLSDKIQIVVRFYGDVAEIHKNYDYVHCTCAWSSWDNELSLPSKALECIINKELIYTGSKYPLCSIFRARKYINRGYTINAGQYVKMVMQLNDMNLKDIEVLSDQLMGVDSGYFSMLIRAIEEQKERDSDFELDADYVIDLVNRIF